MTRTQNANFRSLPILAILAVGACGRADEAPRKKGNNSATRGPTAPMTSRSRTPPPPRRNPGLRPAARHAPATLAVVLSRGGSGRLGTFVGPGPRSRELQARYGVRLAQEVHASAVSDGRALFVVSTRGLVVAARVSDGGVLWSHSTRAGSMAAPGLGGGRLFVGDRTGRVWCFDAKTGAVRWIRKVVGAIRTAPLVHAGRVVVGTLAGRLLALDSATGAVRWELKQQRPFVGVAGSRDGSVVVVASFDRRVRLLEASTGREVWTAMMTSSSHVAPVLTERSVFTLCASGELIRLDRKTGQQVWSRPALGFKSFPPTVAGGQIYVASRKRLLYALDVITGETRWVKPLVDLPSAAPVFARDTLFLTTLGPRLLAIRADNGGHYVDHALPSRVVAEPLPLDDGLLLVDQRGIATLYVKK